MVNNATEKKIKVVIMGGGVAGLSAAHHLLTKGKGRFEVEIYERKSFGGKARSGTFNQFPTEHGFRFFPGFYKHVTETMKEIPLGDGNTVYNNLVNTDVYTFLFANKPGRLDIPINIGTWIGLFQFKKIRKHLDLLRQQIDIANIEIKTAGKDKLIESMLEVYTTCDARIESTYDNTSWTDFIDADNKNNIYGKDYEILLATGISKNLVAVRADVANSRTAAKLIGHMLWHIVSPKAPRADKILNAPTNVAWIEPWVKYLESLGLTTYKERRVIEIEFDPINSIIKGMRHDDYNKIHQPGTQPEKNTSWKHYNKETVVKKLNFVEADYFIMAMPIEKVDEILQRSTNKDVKITSFDHTLANFEQIWKNTEWMTGIIFYFDTEIDIAKGHITIADEEAAVTMISQMQFWGKYLSEHKIISTEKKEVKAILSVIVSNWDAKPKYIDNPGNKMRLKDLTEEEVLEEVKQIIFRCEIEKGKKLGDYRKNLIDFFLDESIVPYDADLADPRYQDIQGVISENKPQQSQKKMGGTISSDGTYQPFALFNKEPLYINKTHSYHLRPTGYTSFTNLFLAGDYIKTNADLGCMDSADEAARRAVNNIFVREKIKSCCKIDDYELPSFFHFFRTARILDYINFKKGLDYRKTIISRLIKWYYKRTLAIYKSPFHSIIKGVLFFGIFLLFWITCFFNLIYKFILKQVYVKTV